MCQGVFEISESLKSYVGREGSYGTPCIPVGTIFIDLHRNESLFILNVLSQKMDERYVIIFHN